MAPGEVARGAPCLAAARSGADVALAGASFFPSSLPAPYLLSHVLCVNGMDWEGGPSSGGDTADPL